MTGFGRVDGSSNLGKLAVEISSLNNRFLDFSMKSPRQFAQLDMRVKELVAAELNRGKVLVVVMLEETTALPEQATIHTETAKLYFRQLTALKKSLGVPGEVTISDLLLLPGVATADAPDVNSEKFWMDLSKCVKKALKEVVAMRKREGKAMANDMRTILEGMEKAVKVVEERTANVVEHYRDKLTARIQEILDNNVHNSVRLEEEIAIFAERSDVTEECSRLRSHIAQFKSTLRLDQPVGKRLNFLLQEMNRETNTIGSKCSDFDISSTVIGLKEEVEKLREIVQNVE
jgi:uncharacterized protein (TIGR00255 family)